MGGLNELENRVACAKGDRQELDRLIGDYLPFLKKQAAAAASPLDYEDRLSIAMLTFAGCVRQYEPARGAFLGFAQACIRNRLIDEARRDARYSAHLVPLTGDEDARALSDAAALREYDRAREQETLSGEIELLSARLAAFGVAFTELPAVCPRQKRARRQCLAVALHLVHTPALREKLFSQRRLPQAELAAAAGLSAKTIEKHRKYLVTLAVLLDGEYPYIRTFLPQYGEVEP